MPLGTDQADGIFCHELVAQRSARLAAVCEKAWKESGRKEHHVYVVGSEVPVPGGAMDNEMTVTDPEQFRRELALFTEAYKAVGADPADIIGFVVQPGVPSTCPSSGARFRWGPCGPGPWICSWTGSRAAMRSTMPPPAPWKSWAFCERIGS